MKMPDAQLPLFPDITPAPRKPKPSAVPDVQALSPELKLAKAVSAPKRQKTRASKAPAKKRHKGAGKPSAMPQMSKVASDLLTVRDVARHCTVSCATIWRWVKGTNGFPQPLRFAPGTTRWRLHDVMAWQASRVGI